MAYDLSIAKRCDAVSSLQKHVEVISTLPTIVLSRVTELEA